MERSQIITALRKKPEVAVLIAGAGINGIGTFRDLALNGVDTLLVDRGDFCSGASAASSHMLHGGIRYLENGEFRLVREALHERNNLLRNAPHYAQPLPTTIPIFKWLSGLWNAPLKFLRLLDRPAERGALVIKIGLMLYDAYVRGDSPMPGHHFRSRDESLWDFPALNPDILFTANYYDALLVPMERLCLELVVDAEAEGNHARALNYASLVGAQGDTVTLRDEVSGKTLDVKPRVVINAAGPWIDLANAAIGRPTRYIGGTKGSHLVLDHPALRRMIGDHEIFFENADGRIVLICPFKDKVLLGTTDIRSDDPDQAACTPEEERYILGLVGRVFPSIQVDPAQIVFRFSGVRPLPSSDRGYAGQISRDHSIEVVEAGDGLNFPILSLVGGKWTSYRAFAEEAADQVLARLGQARTRSTEKLAIGGGRDYPTDPAEQSGWIDKLARRTGLAAERVAALLERYGTRAEEAAAYITQGKDKALKQRPDFSQREIAFLVEREKVIHLDDVVMRRTLLGIMGEMNAGLLAEVADITAKSLGWPQAQRKREIERVEEIFRSKHGVRLE